MVDSGRRSIGGRETVISVFFYMELVFISASGRFYRKTMEVPDLIDLLGNW